MDAILGQLSREQLQTHSVEALHAELQHLEDAFKRVVQVLQRIASVRGTAAKFSVPCDDGATVVHLARIHAVREDAAARLDLLTTEVHMRRRDTELDAAHKTSTPTSSSNTNTCATDAPVVVIDCMSPQPSPQVSPVLVPITTQLNVLEIPSVANDLSIWPAGAATALPLPLPAPQPALAPLKHNEIEILDSSSSSSHESDHTGDSSDRNDNSSSSDSDSSYCSSNAATRHTSRNDSDTESDDEAIPVSALIGRHQEVAPPAAAANNSKRVKAEPQRIPPPAIAKDEQTAATRVRARNTDEQRRKRRRREQEGTMESRN